MAPKKILITGGNGQVGFATTRLLHDSGISVKSLTRHDLDICQTDDVSRAIQKYQPELVINCAAYTAVDRAEEESALAFAINRDGPSYLAQACQAAQIPLIHLSTDYVFAGQGSKPYQEEDEIAPLGIYGLSKWQGEEAVRTTLTEHLIIRTSWVFSSHGQNFVRTMLRLAQERDSLSVVADQHGCPTAANHIAHLLIHLAEQYFSKHSLPWGTYHFCTGPATTWHGFANAIFDQGLERGLISQKIKVDPITSSEYPTPAQRPAYSVLDCRKTADNFNYTIPRWQDGLREVIEEFRLTVDG